MFENIKFNGTFRDYQQKILDGSKRYLSDGRINIVAAPGSGKTILGLELIRRLAKPCLILSPTTTIRNQWGERFEESFVAADGAKKPEVSFDLRKCAPITSVTYQALYSAVSHVKCTEGEEVDYSDLDVFKTVREAGIETVCLDEAHHLQNEWQKALELFITKAQGKLKIISLTATPPYDAGEGEWKRYVSVCGEIDEEIFVPELVRQGTLCPHQDYIYFNYPDGSEREAFSEYCDRASNALKELLASPLLKNAAEALEDCAENDYARLYENAKEVSYVVALLRHAGVEIDKKFYKRFAYGSNVKFDLDCAEAALNFIADGEFFGEEIAEALKQLFGKYKLTERGKIVLGMNDKLRRRLTSSVGKLKSIEEIARCEYSSLGEKLRLLVLTDYIKREGLADIGTEERFDSVNIISVFETLRRTCPFPVGAVSGTLVILPESCKSILKEKGARFSVKPLKDTGYCEYVISGGNREKVNFIGELFKEGAVNALIGTKSLLGEGWDSPCINSLILASFVGSFMLSNQMRGRAIRIDKNNPDKTANIWHLATVEPPQIYEDGMLSGIIARILASSGELNSSDFQSLTRRFECFVAPSYDKCEIQSGIERLSVIKPPYTASGINRINEEMRLRAADRDSLVQSWRGALGEGASLSNCAEIPLSKKAPSFTFYNIGRVFALMGALCLMALAMVMLFKHFGDGSIPFIVIGVALSVVLWVVLWSVGLKIIRNLSPKRSIKNLADCILKTLKQLDIVEDGCTLVMQGDEFYASVSLKDASVRDAKIFQLAVSEIFSPIEDARYVLIPKGLFGTYRYVCALNCPSVFGGKKENAEAFAYNLKKPLGRLHVVYTKSDKGKAMLFACKRFSYINFNDRVIRRLMRYN